MPNKDGTGPLGQGSKNGKGLGKCNNKPNDTSNQTILDNIRNWFRGKGIGGGGKRRNRNGSGQANGVGNCNKQIITKQE